MEFYQSNNNQEDVLNTVPPLPTLQDNESATIAAAHYAPPRRVSVVANNEKDSLQQFRGNNNVQLIDFPAGPVQLRIARTSIPERIQNGIEELAKSAPRKNMFLINEEIENTPTLDRRLNQDGNPVWWWNIR